MSWWQVIDTTGWPELVYETRGRRDKYWVTSPDDAQWLRKSPRESRPTEPAIEVFTLELARRCGFEVAYGRATEWTAADGTRKRGLLSRKFHDETETQYTGAELLQGFDLDSPNARIAATISRVRGALDEGPLLHELLRVLIFDAWIGNGDRHLRNWAILERVKAGTRRFAPMFDTAGALGGELLDNHVLLSSDATDETLELYARACKSGFGDGVSRPGIFQQEVLAEIRTWPRWDEAYKDLLERFNRALEHDVPALLDSIPEDWWSEARRKFVSRLLGVRVKLLEGAVP